MEYPSIPRQVNGQSHDTVDMYCFNTPQEARNFYPIAKQRLLSVNNWHKVMQHRKPVFTLYDETGKQQDGPPEVGDFIRIDLAGPGNPSGQGYDWVRITQLEERTDDFISMKLSPAPSPISKTRSSAHFYQEQASNTLVLRIIHNCIYAEAHGRNELKNITDGQLLARGRNLIVAFMAKLGVGNIQWKQLTKGIVTPEKD